MENSTSEMPKEEGGESEPSTSTVQGKTFIITPDKIAKLGLIEQIKSVFNSQVAPKISHQLTTKPNIIRRKFKLLKPDIEDRSATSLLAQSMDKHQLLHSTSTGSDGAKLNNTLIKTYRTKMVANKLLNDVERQHAPPNNISNSVIVQRINELSDNSLNQVSVNAEDIYKSGDEQTNQLNKLATLNTENGNHILFKGVDRQNTPIFVSNINNPTAKLSHVLSGSKIEPKSTNQQDSPHDTSFTKIRVLSIKSVSLPEKDLQQISQSVVREKNVTKVSPVYNTKMAMDRTSIGNMTVSIPENKQGSKRKFCIQKSVEKQPMKVIKLTSPYECDPVPSKAQSVPGVQLHELKVKKKPGRKKKSQSQKQPIKEPAKVIVLEMPSVSPISDETSSMLPTEVPIETNVDLHVQLHEVKVKKKPGRKKKSESQKQPIKEPAKVIVLEMPSVSPISDETSSMLPTEVPIETNEDVHEAKVKKRPGRKKKSELQKTAIKEFENVVLNTKRTRKKKFESEFITDEEYENAIEMAETMAYSTVSTSTKKRGRKKKELLMAQSIPKVIEEFNSSSFSNLLDTSESKALNLTGTSAIIAFAIDRNADDLYGLQIVKAGPKIIHEPETMQDINVLPEIIYDNKVGPEIIHDNKVDPEIIHDIKVDPEIIHNIKDEPAIIHDIKVLSEIIRDIKVGPEIIRDVKLEPEIIHDIKDGPAIIHDMKVEPEIIHDIKVGPEIFHDVKTDLEITDDVKYEVLTDLDVSQMDQSCLTDLSLNSYSTSQEYS